MFSEMLKKFSFGKLFTSFGKRAPEKRYLKKIPEHDKVKDGKRKGRVDFGKRNHIYAGHCQHSGGILSVLPGRGTVWIHDVSDVSGPGGKAET